MLDQFKDHTPGLTGPASSGAGITPSDSDVLPTATRALYSGTGGDVRMLLVGGDEITLTGLLPGVVYPLRVSKVFATGTTALGLVGLS